MATHIRAHDWSATPLGPVKGWQAALRTAVEMMLDTPVVASLAVGPQRVFLYNDAAAPHYGSLHPDALGRPLAQVFAHEFDRVASLYDRAFSGAGVHVPAQLLDPGRTGTDEVFEAGLTPVRGVGGEVVAVLMMGFARGPEVRAAAALRESESRHRLLLHSWAQAVWETDAAGVVVTDSPSWRAYTGQTLDEWLGYGWLGAIHPDDGAYAERQWRKAMAVRRAVNAEFRMRAPDGGWRWTNVRAAPVLDMGGAVEKWAGINIGIDARKRAEAALRESEDRYRALFQSMDEAYAVVEVLKDGQDRWTDFRFLEVNPAFQKHSSMPWPVGQTATELLGTPNPRWAELYGQALDTDTPIRFKEGEAVLGRVFDLNIFTLDREQNRVAMLFTNMT